MLSPEEIWTFTGHFDRVNSVVVDSDGFVYSGGYDNIVRKINSDGVQVWEFVGFSGNVNGLAVDSDGFVYSANEDNTIKKISSDGVEVWSFTGHSAVAFAVDVDSDGFVYSGSQDFTVRKIDSSGSEVWSFTGHTSTVAAVVVKGDFVYSAGYDDTVRKIDKSGVERWVFTGHSGNVLGLAVDDDGFVYSASVDGSVRKINNNGAEVWSFTGHTGIVYGVSVDSKGFVYSAGQDNTVRKIRSTGEELWSFTGHTDRVRDVFVRDGFFYSAGFDDDVKKVFADSFFIRGVVRKDVLGVEGAVVRCVRENDGFLFDSVVSDGDGAYEFAVSELVNSEVASYHLWFEYEEDLLNSFEDDFDGWIVENTYDGTPERSSDWSSEGSYSLKLRSFSGIDGGSASVEKVIDFESLIFDYRIDGSGYIRVYDDDVLIYEDSVSTGGGGGVKEVFDVLINVASGSVVRFEAQAVSGYFVDVFVDNVRLNNKFFDHSYWGVLPR